MTDAAVEHAQSRSLADLHAPEITYQVKAAPAKKRGAVIGSAAKLSSEGLMAAAKLAKKKEELKRAQVLSMLRPHYALSYKKDLASSAGHHVRETFPEEGMRHAHVSFCACFCRFNLKTVSRKRSRNGERRGR